nr:xylulose kinase-1 [Tanacetum cinerariifolium]
MALTFNDTHNMIAYLTKSDAIEGFDQIIDFLNASTIKYALIVNPNIYVSCIKQFWSSVSVKKVNDVTRLQALVDRKKVIITEVTIREALRLDDAENIDCLPNEEIFTELSRMGYEKPSTKITFYKAFFLPQWKVGKGFSGVEIPLFEGLIVAQQADDVADEGAAGVDVDVFPAVAVEPSIPSPTPTTQPPPPSQELPSTSQVIRTPPPSPIAEPSLPPQQQQQQQQQQQSFQPTHDAGISMDLLHILLETCTTLTRKVEALEQDKVAQALKIIKLKVESSTDTVMDDQEDASKQGEIIANIDADKDVTLKDVAEVEKDAKIEENADVQGRQAESQAQIYKIDLKHADKVLSIQDDELEPSELKEVVEVVTTAKLMTKVVTATAATITAATITDATTSITAATLTAAPSAARRRKGVVIRDHEETATPSIIIHSEPKSKDKGKGIMVEEPKPLKKQAQIEQDEAYARELEVELNKNINWDDVIEQMNMAGFKMDYFKGMSYDDISPIFEKYFHSNVAFLEKTKEQMEEEDIRALKRSSESQAEKAEKKQKLDEEVYVVDYEIYTENNKPYYKIIRADRSSQLFLSFLSLLKNFDREDLEVLWQLVKERFASSKPKNISDDFLLTTLTYMFEKPNIQAQV